MKVHLNQLHNDCNELFSFFNFKLIEALVKSTKNALDMLKKRVGMYRLKVFFQDFIKLTIEEFRNISL